MEQYEAAHARGPRGSDDARGLWHDFIGKYNIAKLNSILKMSKTILISLFIIMVGNRPPLSLRRGRTEHPNILYYNSIILMTVSYSRHG